MRLYPADGLKVTLTSLQAKKRQGERIACLTAYDYPFARLLDEAGVDLLLVGDSWGMAVAGYDSTLPVTMDDIVSATRNVGRGARRALVVADMPYGSYHLGPAQAVANGVRLIKEAGAEAVKLEGARPEIIAALVAAEVPVVAHLGLTPQSVHRLGGYRVQATSESAARQLAADADAIATAGAAALVLEGVPRELAAAVTRRLAIPTIGIGAGPDCDGQILVLHDLLGLSFRPRPKFVRAYADLATLVRGAAEAYRQDVEAGQFPADRESYHTPASISAP